MALDTYAGLKAEVLDWIDDDTLDAGLCVALAESEMRDRLLLGRAEVRAEALISDAFSAVPADFGQATAFRLAGDPARVLTFHDPHNFNIHAASLARSGQPSIYTLEAGQFRFAPAPAAAYPAELTYRQDLVALSDTAPSNWVLARYPHAYLNGAVKFAQLKLLDEARAAIYDALFQRALDSVADADARRRVGPKPRMAFRALA